jgi:hypothetical protein
MLAFKQYREVLIWVFLEKIIQRTKVLFAPLQKRNPGKVAFFISSDAFTSWLICIGNPVFRVPGLRLNRDFSKC